MEYVTSALIYLNTAGAQRLSPLIGFQKVDQNSPLQCSLVNIAKGEMQTGVEVGVWVRVKSIGKNGTEGPVRLFIKWAYIDLLVVKSRAVFEGPQRPQ